MEKLLKKYDIQGPRYTSFPPVPFWNGAPSYSQWILDIKNSYHEDQGVDLYLHVPYCYSICHYCGCNRQAAQDNSQETILVEKLLSEWQHYIDQLGFLPVVNSIHFGGGTPTYLSVQSFEKILSTLMIKTTPHFIGSVELHPHVTRAEHLTVFKKYKINRISIGVQDLNDQVLDACNRKTNRQQIVDFYALCRLYGFESINFDLIYGLPFQTYQSVERTFREIAELKPDLISYFSFAYVPWKMSNQELIDKSALPDPELKAKLFSLGKEILLANGYQLVGLDHFALQDSYLGKAQNEKMLKRSFMGYVDQKSSITIGLGPSAISNTPLSFAQNPRTMQEYLQALAGETSRFCAGHQLTRRDQEAQQVIHDIMCNGETIISKKTFSAPAALLEMIEDGLILMEEDAKQWHLIVTDLGRPYVRNVAMQFDHYLEKNKNLKIFSKTV